MRALIISRRWMVGLMGAVVLVAGGMFLMLRTKTPAPLPFDTGGFVATTPPTIIIPPSSPSLKDLIERALFRLMTKAPTASSFSFPASPTNLCGVQGLLNQCMEVSGVRYLMPRFVAAGTVRFGNTNTLNGPQWVAAFENALQTGTPKWLDTEQRRWRNENLVLIRFPEQKTVLVLPREKATEFQRTNQFGKVDGNGK